MNIYRLIELSFPLALAACAGRVGTVGAEPYQDASTRSTDAGPVDGRPSWTEAGESAAATDGACHTWPIYYATCATPTDTRTAASTQPDGCEAALNPYDAGELACLWCCP